MFVAFDIHGGYIIINSEKQNFYKMKETLVALEAKNKKKSPFF